MLCTITVQVKFLHLFSGDASCLSLLPQDILPAAGLVPAALPAPFDSGPDKRVYVASNLSLKISTASVSLETKRMSFKELTPSVVANDRNAPVNAAENRSNAEVVDPVRNVKIMTSHSTCYNVFRFMYIQTCK